MQAGIKKSNEKKLQKLFAIKEKKKKNTENLIQHN